MIAPQRLPQRNGRRDGIAQRYADENGHRRRHQDIHLGLLRDRLAQLRRNDGNNQYRQRAACSAQLIGRITYGDQRKQNQRIRLEGVANSTGHCGPAMTEA